MSKPIVRWSAVAALVAIGGIAAFLFVGRSAAAPTHALPGVPPPEGIAAITVTAHGTNGQPDITFFASSYEVSALTNAGAKGSHEYAPFLLRKRLESTLSSQLEAAFANGEDFSSVEITAVDSSLTPIFSYVLTDAWIAVYRERSSEEAGAFATEELAFGFKRIVYQVGTPVPDKVSNIFLDREKNANPTNQSGG